MVDREEGREPTQVSRRSFIKGVGAGVASTAVITSGAAAALQQQPADASPGPTAVGPGKAPIRLKINGSERDLMVEPRTTLLNAIRYYLPPNQALTGAKPACDRGACGACTVRLDGRPVYSCVQLAIDCQGKEITTVEGLANGDELTPVQRHMVERDGYQCGFCTSGFIVTMTDLLETNPNPSLEEVRHGLAGNICRCGAYPRIFAATLDAAQEMRGG